MTDKPLLSRLLLLIDDLTEGNKKKFAEMLGVSPTHIDHWVNRGSLPNAEQLENIHRKLNVNLNWLLTGKGEMFVKKKLQDYPTSEEHPLHSPVMEIMIEYGYSKEAREYAHKLFHIFSDKDNSAVNAIKTSIDAFLEMPNKKVFKKTADEK